MTKLLQTALHTVARLPNEQQDEIARVILALASRAAAPEYRRHAQFCRDLATQMGEESQRSLLLGMATEWDQLASQGERIFLSDALTANIAPAISKKRS